jgi:adenylate cyclase
VENLFAKAANAARSASHDAQRQQRVSLAAGLAMVWTVFILLAHFSGALEAFEAPLVDWRLSLHAYPSPASSQLALVAIDNIPPDKPWPWSRFEYSIVLHSLNSYAPSSVVFDVSFNDHDSDAASFDDTFSHQVQRANTVVFAATGMVESGPPPLENIDVIPFTGGTHDVPRYASAVWPLATFASGSPIGVNNIEPESDLRLRQLPLVFLLKGQMVPSLVLQATAQLLGADLAASQVQVGRAILLRSHDGRLLRTVPIDEQGRMRIRYHRGQETTWATSFDNIALFDDQMQNGIAPGMDLRSLVHRQVWIGRTDLADHERFQTPIGQLSRTEVELQAERTILDQDYLRPLPPMILAVLYFLFAIAIAASVVRFGPRHAVAITVIALSFWIETSMVIFRGYNVILPLVGFALLIVGAYATGLLAQVWDLEAEDDEPVRQKALPPR